MNSKRKRFLIAGIVLLLLAVVVLAFLFQEVEIGEQAGSRPDAPPYGVRGSYSVGIRNLVVGGDSPLDITVWYPALNADGYEMVTTYPNTIKLSGGFGSLRLATLGGQAIQGAPFDLSESPYPVVVLSPGFSMEGASYGWLAEHLASHGFVVVSPEHLEGVGPGMNDLWRSVITRPQDILTVFTYLDEQVRAGGDLEGLLDPQLVAVIGHSYGGYTSLAAAGARIDFDSFKLLCDTDAEEVEGSDIMCGGVVPHEADMVKLAGLDPIPPDLWPAWADPRVDAIVPMAGDAYLFNQAGLAPIDVPVMAMGGTQDTGTPFVWGVQPAYEYVSSPRKIKIAFQDAGHMIFTGTCQSVYRLVRMNQTTFELVCTDPVWDRNYVHDLVKHFATAFLLAELKQNREAATALSSEAIDFPGVDYQAEGY
jgi:predicted dienelactone hydrolase